MKKNKKLISIFSLGLTTFTPLISASCGSSKELNIKEERQKWDSNLIIQSRGYNDGWDKVKGNFETLLTNKYNQLKNASTDQEVKNSKDVVINFAKTKDKGTLFQNLQKNDANTDFALLPYSYLTTKWNNKNDTTELDKTNIQIAGQSETLKFKWTAPDNTIYTGNGENLENVANYENNFQFSATYGEFPQWSYSTDQSSNEWQKYKWDGSKFGFSYYDLTDANNLTYLYRGAIYIAGDLTTRTKITNEWKNKQFDNFISNGIVMGDKNSGGSYKYQVALLAKHFNKSIQDVATALNSHSYSGEDIDAAGFIGKEVDGKTYNIAFQYEGDFNWTQQSWYDDKAYTPKDYPNSVVRVLTVTNPAPYDVVFARSGLNPKQIKLLIEAFKSLTIDQNMFGIYTGFNRIVDISRDEFNTFYKLQLKTETNGNENITVPNIK